MEIEKEIIGDIWPGDTKKVPSINKVEAVENNLHKKEADHKKVENKGEEEKKQPGKSEDPGKGRIIDIEA